MVVVVAATAASLPWDFTRFIKAARYSRALSSLSALAVTLMSADRKLEDEEDEVEEEEEDRAYLTGKPSSGLGFSVSSAGLFLPDREPGLAGDGGV